MSFKLYDLKSVTVKVHLLRDGCSNKYDATISNAADVEKFMGEELRKLNREYFLVIYLIFARLKI
jgi:DNA repair protein RadC